MPNSRQKLAEAKQILSNAPHLCNQANFPELTAIVRLLFARIGRPRNTYNEADYHSISLVACPAGTPPPVLANHGGKMNQKFSTSLHQSFDVHRISDRRGKSGHRA
jgi:hypothetical protein